MKIIKKEKFIWENLKRRSPIVLYGMGNGADKILKLCFEKEIVVSGIFASDDFIRGHSFHGFTVLPVSKIDDYFDNPAVLLCFGSELPDMLNRFETIYKKYDFYAPDVPLFGEKVFDFDFYAENKHEIETVYNLLADEKSKKVYENTINYKLSGDIGYLHNSFTTKQENACLLNIESDGLLDIGAYNGDTIEFFIQNAYDFKRVFAFEPDKKNYEKLLNKFPNAALFNICAWNKEEKLYFEQKKSRNSALSKYGKTEISGNSVDNIINEEISLIKVDVEGAEEKAIEGAQKTIEKYEPNMIISLYHRSEDVFKLPLLIHKNYPFYKLFIRQPPYVPCWDLQLYCVRKSK